MAQIGPTRPPVPDVGNLRVQGAGVSVPERFRRDALGCRESKPSDPFVAGLPKQTQARPIFPFGLATCGHSFENFAEHSPTDRGESRFPRG